MQLTITLPDDLATKFNSVFPSDQLNNLDFIGMWDDKSFTGSITDNDVVKNEVNDYIRQLRKGRHFE